MPEQWEALRDRASRSTWRGVVLPIARELREQSAPLAEVMVQRMRQALPDVMPDAETAGENALSIEQTVRSIADGIEGESDPRQVQLPAATLAFAQAGVRRHLAPGLFARSYRMGHELLWDWCFERIQARSTDSAELARATALLTRWTFGYADAAVTRVEEVLEEERDRWLRSAMAARGAAITAVLSGEERDQERASNRLRYEVARHHLGISGVCDALPQDRDPQEALAQEVATLARTLRADPPLIHPTGVTTCMAWVSRPKPFDPGELAALTRHTDDQVRLALGEPGSGLDGFRRTQLEAAHARRVAAAARLTGLVRYADVAVAALATADPEHADAFVRRVLGQLAADDDTSRRAAQALAVYLDENRSRSRAAALLHVHPNTVTYRVQQAERLLDRSIDTLHLDVRVALALLPSLRGTAGT